MRYKPTEVVTPLKVVLVCKSVAITSTLGTTAPPASVIRPVMAPRSPCEKAGNARNRSAIHSAASENGLVLINSSCLEFLRLEAVKVRAARRAKSFPCELTRAVTPTLSTPIAKIPVPKTYHEKHRKATEKDEKNR